MVRWAFGVIMIVLSLVLMGCQTQSEDHSATIMSKSGETTFSIEIVSNGPQMAQGLMYRKHLPSDSGMLFWFADERQHTFWMKNTLIPLEMVFIAKNGTIVGILQAEPCVKDPCPTYSIDEKSLYVLELNANSSHVFGFGVGDLVKIGG